MNTFRLIARHVYYGGFISLMSMLILMLPTYVGLPVVIVSPALYCIGVA